MRPKEGDCFHSDGHRVAGSCLGREGDALGPDPDTRGRGFVRTDGKPRAGLGLELPRPEHPAGKEIHLAQKVGHEQALGTLVEVFRGSDLLHDTVVHDGHAIRHRERFLLVVRHEYRRQAQAALQRPDFLANLQDTVICGKSA